MKEPGPANRLKASFESVAGKVQEAVGDIAGDSKVKVAGEAKQAESQARNAVENARSDIRRAFNKSEKLIQVKTYGN